MQCGLSNRCIPGGSQRFQSGWFRSIQFNFCCKSITDRWLWLSASRTKKRSIAFSEIDQVLWFRMLLVFSLLLRDNHRKINLGILDGIIAAISKVPSWTYFIAMSSTSTARSRMSRCRRHLSISSGDLLHSISVVHFQETLAFARVSQDVSSLHFNCQLQRIQLLRMWCSSSDKCRSSIRNLILEVLGNIKRDHDELVRVEEHDIAFRILTEIHFHCVVDFDFNSVQRDQSDALILRGFEFPSSLIAKQLPR